MSTADPQSFNRYTYCDNDPINHVDLAGLSLADIGVYQTDDSAAAQAAQNNSDIEFRNSFGKKSWTLAPPLTVGGESGGKGGGDPHLAPSGSDKDNSGGESSWDQGGVELCLSYTAQGQSPRRGSTTVNKPKRRQTRPVAPPAVMLVVQSSGPQSEGGYTSRQFGWNMGPYSPGFGAIVDSNQQIYPTLSFGVGPGLPVSYSQTYGDGPVEPGLYVYASGSNILSANLSWRVGRNTNIGREVGVGTPSGGIGVQLVFPALRGTTREDIEYRHADYGHHGNWGGGHRW